MAANREQEPKKRRLEESLEVEPVDTVAVEADRRLAKSVFIERLLRSVARSCTGRGLQNCPEACHYYHSIEDPSTACTENRPVVKICEMLALHEEQVLIYLSESADSFPEETASTYELLEASWFERERSTPVRKRLLTGPCLEFFRRAQRIRDRSGISRGNSSLRCFNSVRDITELEGELAGGEPLDFLLQCIALAEDVCIDNMYCCINSHALLKSFHEEVFHRGRLSPLCVDVYAERFENLSIRGEVPKWCQLRSYLDRPFPSFSSDASELFYANIPCWKLDEAFRRVTSHFLNCFAPAKRRCFVEGRQESDLIGPDEVEGAANALSMLLDDGADLELREPHDILHREQSSLGALVELADMVSTLPIETLVPFICCPLKREEGKVTFDITRPARLTCLAALKIGTMEECPRVPSQVRLCIRMHQDLKSQLRNEPLRIAVIGRRVLGDSYPIDYPESEDQPGSSGTENWDRKVRTRWMRAEAITQPQIMMRRGHVYIDPANE